VWLVVGLGNPGTDYAQHRHNIGFMVVDVLAERWGLTNQFRQKFGAMIAQKDGAVLCKPQEFMNTSGQATQRTQHFYKIPSTQTLVIHDELDLGPLTFKLKTGGGTGGHNGLKSIDAALGAGKLDYHRVRIGIGHPRELGLPQEPVDYVLGRYTKAELSGLDAVLDRVRLAVERIVSGDMRGAMTEFNAKAKE